MRYVRPALNSRLDKGAISAAWKSGRPGLADLRLQTVTAVPGRAPIQSFGPSRRHYCERGSVSQGWCVLSPPSQPIDGHAIHPRIRSSAQRPPAGGTRASPPASPVDTQTDSPPTTCNNVSIAGPPPPLALQLGVGTLDSVTLGACARRARKVLICTNEWYPAKVCLNPPITVGLHQCTLSITFSA